MRWSTLAFILCVVLLAVLIFLPFLIHTRTPDNPTARCRVNARTIAAALLSYAADNDDALPNALTWPDAARLCGMEPSALHCPADKRPWPETGMRRRPLNVDRYSPRSYDMLQSLSGQRTSIASTPDQLLLIYEIGDWGVAYRHRDGMNVAFIDGHVLWLHKRVATPAIILGGLYPPVESKPRGK